SAIRRERSAKSSGPDQLDTRTTDFNFSGLALSETMKYTSYILAFQLCIVLGSLGCYCQDPYVKEAENLKKYFNARDPEVADNGTLFLDILRTWREEGDRKIMQSQIISFYFKLFKNFKDNQSIQKSMETIKEDMNVKFFNSNKRKQDDFERLTNYSVNDSNVQRKAIHELIQVMAELSPAPKIGKRKRSQMLFRGRRASQ
ncbi:Interferon gamma, partial [Plecturocebus cupreus]